MQNLLTKPKPDDDDEDDKSIIIIKEMNKICACFVCMQTIFDLKSVLLNALSRITLAGYLCIQNRKST